ncbi:MAG: right-handed parallel beta-helix repeat-containing protein [Candidatus Heimdallarchaeota archaeon]
MSSTKKRNKIILIALLMIVGLVIAATISYFAVIIYKFLNMPLGLSTYKSIFHLDEFEINGFSGSGTNNDPFILENEFIDVDYFIGIYIHGVDASLIIRNCTFSNQVDNGINIESVNGNVSLYNNTFLCSSGAIIINEVNTISIFDNHFTKSVSVYNSNGAIITKNIFEMEKADSFYINGLTNASITENRFYNCGMSMFEDNIINIQSWIFEDNKVNDLPLLLLIGEENDSLSYGNYGQIVGIGCKNFTISGFEIENSGRSINLINSQNCTIEDNTITGGNTGIDVYYGSDVNILNNTVTDCSYGIETTNAARSTIKENTITSSEYGIYVYGPKNDNQSEACLIIQNTCEGGEAFGIRVSSDYCQILYNVVKEYKYQGIYLSAHNNSIHHNTLIDNNLRGESQAKDTGLGSVWYDSVSMEGNYWSDWSGRGTYSIEGSAEQEDIYPMLTEGEKRIGVGGIIAISISSVFGIGAIIIIVYFVLKKKRETKLKE